MWVQTSNAPLETVTFCRTASVFSRSGTEMSLFLSSTHPSYLPNGTKPESLSPASAMLYTMWNSFIRSDSTQHVPGCAAPWGSAREVGTLYSTVAREVLCRKAGWKKACHLRQQLSLQPALPSTCLLPAPPPAAYLALALVRPLHPPVQLTAFAGGEGEEKVFSLISFIKGSSKCCCSTGAGWVL